MQYDIATAGTKPAPVAMSVAAQDYEKRKFQAALRKADPGPFLQQKPEVRVTFFGSVTAM